MCIRDSYETAKWGKFLSIIGFIGIGLMVFIILGLLIFGGVAMSSIDGFGLMGGMGFGFVAVFYGFMIALYFIPTLYLYRYSTKMKIALDANDQESLSHSFRNLKSLYKFWGIFTAIIIGFYVLIFLFALIGGGLGAFL